MIISSKVDPQKEDYTVARLRRHLFGLRKNKLNVALIVLALEGYDVELNYIGEPNASLAKELLNELGDDATSVWSCSTKDGGFWETWERDAMKYGELTSSWNVWKARKGI